MLAETGIDYVWLSSGLASRASDLRATVVATDVSDHRPLVVGWSIE